MGHSLTRQAENAVAHMWHHLHSPYLGYGEVLSLVNINNAATDGQYSSNRRHH
jgi:hypothetical protein